MNRATNFFISSDHRIKLAITCSLCEIARIFLQCVIGVFCRSIVGGAAFAQFIDRAIQRLRGNTGLRENFARFHILLGRHREEKALDGDVGIARFLRDFLRRIEEAHEIARGLRIGCAAARDFRLFGDPFIDEATRFTRIAARAVNEAGSHAFRIVEKGLQKMFGR